MAESLESLVEKFKIKIQKLEEENLEREATLEAKHQQEMELLSEKEKVEREELEAKQKLDREELLTKQSQRMKDLTAKQHQEKEKSKNDYGEKLKAIMENKMCPNTSKKEVPECPVCLESMNPPMRIFQCSSGHYICEDCNNNKEIKSCPTCRQKIVGRNIGMEQAIQLIVAPSDIPSKHQREVVQNQQESSVASQINDRGLTCDKCTLINKEGDKFCDACGAQLGILDSPIRRTRKNGPVQSPGAEDFRTRVQMAPGFPLNGFDPRIPPGFPGGYLPRGFPQPMIGNRGDGISRIGHQGRQSTGGGPRPERFPRDEDESSRSRMAIVCDRQQLFVGNLPHSCTEQDLRELFSTFGKVTDVRINLKKGRENQSKPGREGVKVPNFGFIAFDNGDAVEKALKAKPILLFGSHRLNVEEKKMRTPRGNMGGVQGGFHDFSLIFSQIP